MRVKRHTGRMERGQSFVEMALGMVFFLFVVLGVLDLGRLYYIYVAMEDGAAEAALYLALNANCPEPNAGECADPNNARYRASHANSQGIDWENVTINYQYVANATVGDMVKVELSYPFKLLTPVISTIAGNSIVLHTESYHAVIER